MIRVAALAVVVGAAATLVSCANLDGASSAVDAIVEVTKGTVIRNVIVVNTRDGSLLPNRTLVIDDGKIQSVTVARAVRTSGTARAIDGAGKYVVPGYLDMHTHAMPAVDRQPSFWPLMLANGITGIREMAGSAEAIKRAQKLNADRAAGVVDAPEVVLIPSDAFAIPGPPPTAAAQVRAHKVQGAGFVKIVNASRDATLAILAEAKTQGLEVAGHLPISVGAIESSDAGWRAHEHLGAGMGILLDCATEETNIRRAILGGEGARPPFPPTFILTPLLYRALDAPFYRRVLDSYDENKCQTVARAFVKNGTWQVPTLHRLRTMQFSDDQAYRSDPNLKYVDKTSRALWEDLARQYSSSVPPAAAETFRQYYGLQQRVVKLMKRSGVKMLAGSDLGGIWVIPGVSLHQEFRELAASGLAPLEVLQMTTLNAAEFLRREATMGTVEVGKNADLVLLDANPIDDVANLGKISAVISRGKYFSSAAVQMMKSELAQALSNEPLRSLNTVLDTAHLH